ncbi:ATP-binding protein [Paratractidigestivibacter faecalis]|uniref:ATP-binding protein n=1 Tax=Paratractidigestivibacter faecalis TaxID=2292441 RepID=UPI003A8E45D5
MDDVGLLVNNPGGFIEGIGVRNLLSAEPQGRNPCLMDALKRVGLAERTGRGVDRIYRVPCYTAGPCPITAPRIKRWYRCLSSAANPTPSSCGSWLRKEIVALNCLCNLF